MRSFKVHLEASLYVIPMYDISSMLPSHVVACVCTKELNLIGKYHFKKNFGREFHNQGIICLLVKNLLQFIVCISNESTTLAVEKSA